MVPPPAPRDRGARGGGNEAPPGEAPRAPSPGIALTWGPMPGWPWRGRPSRPSCRLPASSLPGARARIAPAGGGQDLGGIGAARGLCGETLHPRLEAARPVGRAGTRRDRRDRGAELPSFSLPRPDAPVASSPSDPGIETSIGTGSKRGTAIVSIASRPSIVVWAITPCLRSIVTMRRRLVALSSTTSTVSSLGAPRPWVRGRREAGHGARDGDQRVEL